MRRVKTISQETKSTSLRREPLIEELENNSKRRNWRALTDGELIQHAKITMKIKGITGRDDLKNRDPGLYEVLRIRNLLDKIDLEKKYRDWSDFNNEELIEHAEKIIREKGLRKRIELKDVDPGIYEILRIRKLLNKLDFQDKNRLKELKDEELIELAKKFMEEKGINGRTELAKKYKTLYSALRIRGLLDKVGFREKRKKPRAWKHKKDNEIIVSAKKTIKENKINGRKELKEADSGLYEALRKRKLLDCAFSDMELAKQKPTEIIVENGLLQAADAMEQFGDAG
jgi:hypothetical protein